MIYYKEEELLMVTERDSAWGFKEKSVIWEKHAIKRVDDYYLGLCVNCLQFFLRRQKCNDYGGGVLMDIRNVDSSVVENNAEQYNQYAPKVAYGIVAWLLRYTYYDEDLGCLSANESIDTILNRYRDECYKRWQYQNEKKYHHYSIVTPSQAEIGNLDKSFLTQHITQERESINTFDRPTFIVEAHYKALLELCNNYLKYSAIKQQQSEPQEIAQDLECLFPMNILPKWNYGKVLCELKELRRRNGKGIVSADLTLDRFMKHIQSADVSFIQGEQVKGYKIAFIRQASQTMPDLWKEDAMRKANLTAKDVSSFPLKTPQIYIQKIIIKHTE